MRAVLLSGALLAICAPAASAAKFKGRTSQDRPALVKTNERGFPVLIDIQWRARCRNDGPLVSSTAFRPPYDERTRTSVRDVGSYTFRVRNARTGRYVRVRVRRTNLRARRVARGRWEGTFGATAVVRDGGRVIDRCRTGAITWRASR